MDLSFIFIIAVLIMSVVIHEVSHGYAALALGDPTAKYEGRLTLNPISHLDIIGSILVPLLGFLAGGFIIGWAKPVPFNPYNLRPERWGLPARAGEALVAVAGPFSNIVLAIIFGLVLRFSFGSGVGNEAFVGILGYVVIINIVLALFNLMPIPPLDGSKILFALLPYRFQELRLSLERYGLFIVLFFVFFFWRAVSPTISNIFSLLTGMPL